MLMFLPIDIERVSLSADSPTLLSHITYQHFHAGFFHLVCNAWCLLTFAFCTKLKMKHYLIAFLFSALIPSCILPESTHVVGLSGVLYALLGMQALKAPTLLHKAIYQVYVLVFLLAGLLFPNVSFAVHAYCYVLGLVYAFITYPFIKTKTP